MSVGQTHQHIVRLWWTNPSTGKTGNNSRDEIIAWIEDHDGKAYVDEGGYRVNVYVRTPASGPKFLQTAADGRWLNNLLALPRM
jgi:hypothetical protein